MALRSILAVRGIEQTTEDFRRSLIELADRQGLDPSILAAVISFESGFDPAAVNPVSGATGLIQFMPATAKAYGTTTEQLAAMTAEEQLPFVERHYAAAGPVSSLEDHYMAVLTPQCVGAPPDAALPCGSGPPWKRPLTGCTEPPQGPYCQNAALDADGDGLISVAEAVAPIRSLLQEAATRLPVLVEMNPTGRPPITAATKLLPFALGFAGGLAGMWAVNKALARPVALRRRG